MAERPTDVVFVVTAGMSGMFIDPLAEQLAARGRTVAIVANNSDGFRRGDDVRQRTGLRRSDAPGRVEIHSLPFRRRPSPVRDVVHLLRLVAYLRATRPRVVHASTPKGGLLGVLAGRLTRRPVVVYQARGLRSENTGGLSGGVQRLLERTCIRLAHRVVVNSESLRRAMIEASVLRPGEGEVIGGGGSVGVDTSRFVPAPPGSPRDAGFTVGYVGRMNPDKGMDSLAAVFTAVKVVRPDARLLLVGDRDEGRTGADDDPISALIRESAPDDVEITGFVDDVVPHLQRMDLLVFPSSREGLPNAPLEAQACGVPVVAYRVTGVVDAVGDGVGGLLVDAGDERALVAAAIELVGNEARRRELGTGGRSFVQRRFERSTVVANNVDYIDALVAGGTR